MSEFVKAKYHSDQKIVEYVTTQGKRLLRSGGSLCWRTNNCGNLSSPVKNGSPSPKKTKNYIGFAQVKNPEEHFFFIFPDYATGRAQLKATLERKYADKTLAQTIEAYAPSHENDTENYLSQITKATGLTSNSIVGDLNLEQYDRLMDAVENAEGYHKDEGTRKEIWVETTSITITNGAQPIPNGEIFLETSKGHIKLKADEYGQINPIPHPKKGVFLLKQKKEDNTWHTLLTIAANAPSKIYNLIVNTVSVTASTLTHKAPPDAKSKPIPLAYRVKPGDSLSKIALTYRTTAEEIKKINDLKSDLIYPEQRLWLYAQGVLPASHVLAKPIMAKSTKAAPNADLVRSKGGTGQGLALVPIAKTQAPWMSIALHEAKQWAGKTEDVITKTDNYHRMVTDNDRAGGQRPVKDKDGKPMFNKDGTPKMHSRWDGLNTMDGSNQAWCASFLNYCLKESGYAPTTLFMRAASFKTEPAKYVKIDKPVYGAIRYVPRSGGSGHVSFVYGKEGDKLVVLGGNQTDQITFSNEKHGEKGEAFYVPIAYKNFAEKDKENDLQECDVTALRKEYKTLPPKKKQAANAQN